MSRTACGHPTSCCSAAEIAAVLFFQAMRYWARQPAHPSNDCFVLSKGHAAPLLYAAWAEASFLKEPELLNLRKINSDLEGHPTPRLPFVDVATGLLGQGLGVACGMAYSGKYFDRNPGVLAHFCSLPGGGSLPGVEDAENWHGKPMPKDKVESIIGAIQSQIQTHEVLVPQPPIEDVPQISIAGICMPSPSEYTTGDKVATRKAYGVALAKLGAASEHVVALDGDTKNSTFSELFKQAHPERYIECYIAEQNMVSVILGCAARDQAVVFASTFAAFFTRAFVHIRMGAISQSNLNLCGSHCGVSIGEDGPSQMALEDIAMFRAIPGCTVFYPSDAVSTERAVCLAANTKGICFIRTSRPETPVIYPPEETFEIGQAKVVHKSDADRVTVIGAGVTLHEALAAAHELAKQGTHIRVIDPFTIKPLDAATIVNSAQATGGRIITVEDHYTEGGIGEAVAGEPGMVLQSLAVCGVPQSGKPAELLDLFGISTKSIIAAVKNTFAS
ncbi:LOW QUALITY PROTEIN: transketolase-like protein 1 [Chelonoidis abingdonii]|uniref:LOW QUALITY PROTEIN: transketolase-like protein 1 n=1 Tax=Chelonoidis abingdonii TaxID=106734 RepID=UPI003F492210